MNTSKSLIACILCTMAFSCIPAKADYTVPAWLAKSAKLVGTAFVLNTVGFTAVHTLGKWDANKLSPIKYGLIGGIVAAGLVADILLLKAAASSNVHNFNSRVQTI